MNVTEKQEVHSTQEKEVRRRHPKRSVSRCLRKWLYYKPKTFLGVTVASAVLTAVVTAYVQMFFDFNLPFSKHLKRQDRTELTEKGHRPNKENKNQNQNQNQSVDLEKLTEFLQILGNMVAGNVQTENMLQLNCPTCSESVKITQPVYKGVTVTCNACQTQLFTQARMKELVYE